MAFSTAPPMVTRSTWRASVLPRPSPNVRQTPWASEARPGHSGYIHSGHIIFLSAFSIACGASTSTDLPPEPPQRAETAADPIGEPDPRPGPPAEPPPEVAVDTYSGPCRGFRNGEEVGRVYDAALAEISGIDESLRYPGLLYAHNDSGDDPRVYLLNRDGTYAATIRLENAQHIDYEDIAVARPQGSANSFVYVGDVGDNAARNGGRGRRSITVYRFAEPDVDRQAPPTEISVRPDRIELRYRGRPHDCEALAVDETNGDLYLMSKENLGPPSLFVARAPLRARARLEHVAEVPLGSDHAPGAWMATAMDLSPSGRAMLVRSYTHVHLWVRGEGQSWPAVLRTDAIGCPARAEGQGESVAFVDRGRAYMTISEGRNPALYHYAPEHPSCTPE